MLTKQVQFSLMKIIKEVIQNKIKAMYKMIIQIMKQILKHKMRVILKNKKPLIYSKSWEKQMFWERVVREISTKHNNK